MDNSNLVEFKKICSDNRGILSLLKFGDYESLVSFTKGGKSRSGYYFKENRIYVILSGSFEFHEKNIETGEEEKKIIKTGDHFTVKPNIAHFFTALEDSFMIEFTPHAKEKVEMIPYKPYREICEKDI